MFVAQQLQYSLRLCASIQLVSLKVTLISGSVGHHTVSVLDGHSPPLFGWGSWNESFVSLLGVLASFVMKRSLDRGLPWWFGFESFPLWLLLAVCCLCSSGDTPFCSMVDFPLCSMVTLFYCGSLPWRSSSIYVGWSGCLGSPFIFVRRLLGCLWLG